MLDSNTYIKNKDWDKLKELDTRLDKISKDNGAVFLSPLDELCKDKKCLAVVKYQSKYWLTSWDNGHLTEAGSVYLYKALEKKVNE